MEEETQLIKVGLCLHTGTIICSCMYTCKRINNVILKLVSYWDVQWEVEPIRDMGWGRGESKKVF